MIYLKYEMLLVFKFLSLNICQSCAYLGPMTAITFPDISDDFRMVAYGYWRIFFLQMYMTLMLAFPGFSFKKIL